MITAQLWKLITLSTQYYSSTTISVVNNRLKPIVFQTKVLMSITSNLAKLSVSNKCIFRPSSITDITVPMLDEIQIVSVW